MPAKPSADRLIGPLSVDDLISFAHQLLDEAGTLGRQWFRQPLDIESKSDDSPVTQADKAIETLVRQRITDRFADHGLLGEEHGRDRMDATYVWVVDPIDGTRSFITGWPVWGTLLALTEEGTPRLGFIDMPALGERWIGRSGADTVFHANDGTVRRCQTRQDIPLSQAHFYTTSSFYFDNGDWDHVHRVAAATGTPRFGGDCYSYGLLASGHIDLIIEARLQPFDYMALIPVIEGAGGIITDWQGKPLGMQSDGRVVAAGSAQLHHDAIRLLAGGA